MTIPFLSNSTVSSSTSHASLLIGVVIYNRPVITTHPPTTLQALTPSSPAGPVPDLAKHPSYRYRHEVQKELSAGQRYSPHSVLTARYQMTSPREVLEDNPPPQTAPSHSDHSPAQTRAHASTVMYPEPRDSNRRDSTTLRQQPNLVDRADVALHDPVTTSATLCDLDVDMQIETILGFITPVATKPVPPVKAIPPVKATAPVKPPPSAYARRAPRTRASRNTSPPHRPSLRGSPPTLSPPTTAHPSTLSTQESTKRPKQSPRQKRKEDPPYDKAPTQPTRTRARSLSPGKTAWKVASSLPPSKPAPPKRRTPLHIRGHLSLNEVPSTEPVLRDVALEELDDNENSRTSEARMTGIDRLLSASRMIDTT